MTAEQKIKKTLADAEILILACKAKGGYKFRERFRCSDVELEKILKQCEAQIRGMAISLLVAETMLSEQPPSFHCRWDEYQGRRKEAIQTKT